MPLQYRHSGPFSGWMRETGGKVLLVPYGLLGTGPAGNSGAFLFHMGPTADSGSPL